MVYGALGLETVWTTTIQFGPNCLPRVRVKDSVCLNKLTVTCDKFEAISLTYISKRTKIEKSAQLTPSFTHTAQTLYLTICILPLIVTERRKNRNRNMAKYEWQRGGVNLMFNLTCLLIVLIRANIF